MHKYVPPISTRMRAQRTAFYRLLEFLPVPVLVSKARDNATNDEPVVTTTFLNREFLRVIGYTTAEFRDIDAGCRLLFPDPLYRSCIRERWTSVVRAAATTGARPTASNVKIHCRDGVDRWFSVVADLSGAICKNHYVIIFHDVTQEIETLNQLRQLSETDPLTGLATRRVILDQLKQLTTINSPSPTSLIMCDIDNFKRINDDFGHEAGDRALEYIAHILTSHIRAGDVAARWGGEEFLLLLPNATAEAACDVANRLHQILNTPDSWHVEFDRPITMTFGVATHNELETFDDTIRRADAALYRGKAAGRNRLVLHHGVRASVVAETTFLANDLPIAPAFAALAPRAD